MKYITIIFTLTLITISAFSAETVEQRLVKLEQTVKAQSDSIATYKAKVAEVELQRNFLSDIYNGNSAWFIGIVSLVIVLIVGFSVYSNKEDLKEFKVFTENKTNEVESKYIEFKNDIVNSFDKKIEEYTIHLKALNEKINIGLIDVYYVSSLFYTRLSRDNSLSDTKEKFTIQILALKSIIVLNTITPDKDNGNLNFAFNSIVDTYKSTLDINQLDYMKKMYFEEICGIDIKSFSSEFQIYLKSKIQEVLLSLK